MQEQAARLAYTLQSKGDESGRDLRLLLRVLIDFIFMKLNKLSKLIYISRHGAGVWECNAQVIKQVHTV